MLWHQNYSKPFRQILATLAAIVALNAIRPCAISGQEAGPGLKDLDRNGTLRVGFEISPEILPLAPFTETIKREANLGTVGTYWLEGGMHAESREVYNWERPDRVVDFLCENRIKVHGNPLFWPSDIHTPDWVLNSDPRDARAILEEHIAAVAGRYRGKVDQWIVVNEAFVFDGGFRDSYWYQALGAKYLKIAFEAAAAADPDAELIYNDHGLVEIDNRKFKAVVKKIRSLRRKGVKVDGVGFQLHLHVNQVLDPKFPLEDRLREIKQNGLRSYITELDIVIPTPADRNDPGKRIPERSEANLRLQKQAYKKVIETYLRVEPAGGIQTWGISDAQSWLGAEQFPLLFDENLNRKPAYDGVAEAIRRDFSGVRRLRHLWTGGYLCLDPTFHWDGAIVQTIGGTGPWRCFMPHANIESDPRLNEGCTWDIQDIDGDGTYRLQSLSNGRFLNVNGFDSAPANVYPLATEWLTQKWDIQDLGNGRYLISNAYTCRYLQPKSSWNFLRFWRMQEQEVNTGRYWLNGIWEIEYIGPTVDSLAD